jgi:hypothetical protein
MILLSLFSQYIYHCYFSIKFIHSTQKFSIFHSLKMNIKIALNADFLRTLIELVLCLNGDAAAYNKHKAMSSDEFRGELNHSIVSGINALRDFEEKILQDRNEPIEWTAVHLESRTNSTEEVDVEFVFIK